MPSKYSYSTLLFAATSKFISYGALRVTYALSSFLVGDWKITESQFGIILSITELAGALSGSVMGWISIYCDATTVMIMTLLLQGLMLVISTALGTGIDVTTFFILMILTRAIFGFCFDIYMITMQTVLTLDLTLEERDRVVAIIELPWALSALIAVPLLSLLYGATNWRIMYLILGGLLVLFAATIPFIFRPSWITQFKRTTTTTNNITTTPSSSSRKRNSSFHQQQQQQQQRYQLQPSASFRRLNNNDTTNTTSPKQCPGFQSFQTLLFNISGFFWAMAANLIYTSFSMGIKRSGLNESQGGALSIFLGLGELIGAVIGGLYTQDSSLEVIAILEIVSIAFFFWARQISLELAVFSVTLFFVFSETGIIQRFSRAPLFGEETDSAALLGNHIQFQFVGRAVGAAIAPLLYVNSSSVIITSTSNNNGTTTTTATTSITGGGGGWNGGDYDCWTAMITTFVSLITVTGSRWCLNYKKKNTNTNNNQNDEQLQDEQLQDEQLQDEQLQDDNIDDDNIESYE
jgi:MFS family permease